MNIPMNMADVLSLCLVYLVLLTRKAVNGEQCHCAKLVHLVKGKRGTIPCQCAEYRHVAWYTETEYDGSGSPFITFNSIDNRKAGPKIGEYDIALNGSLIIKNVTLSSNHSYVVEFTFTVGTPPYISRPHIIVIAFPGPMYPVVNGYVNKQYVHMFVERWGTLHCSVAGVHPRVNLTWSVVDPSQRDKISFQLDDMDTSQNEDGTFYVSSTTNYTAELSIQSSVVKCQVADEISSFFPAVATVELSFPPAFPVPMYPVVNGYVNKQYVHMFVERWGTLHCSVTGVHPRVNLTWSVVDPSQRDKISFQLDDMDSSQNEDGTFYVSSTTNYTAELSIQSSVVKCQVADEISSFFPAVATVELSFPPAPFPIAVPIIDGCYSQQTHCVQEVAETGKLTCTVMNSLYPIVLKWTVLGLDPSKLIFENEIQKYQNDSKSFNASITTSYMAVDESLTLVTVQCVSESLGDYHVSHSVAILQLTKAGESLNCAEIRIIKAVLAMVIILSSLILTSVIAGFVKMVKNTTKILRVMEPQTPRAGECSILGESST